MCAYKIKNCELLPAGLYRVVLRTALIITVSSSALLLCWQTNITEVDSSDRFRLGNRTAFFQNKIRVLEVKHSVLEHSPHVQPKLISESDYYETLYYHGVKKGYILLY